MFKKSVFICTIFFIINAYLFSEDRQIGISPEDYEAELLNQTENLTQEEIHARLIMTAEIRQVTGDLSGAAEYFKQASLIIKGNKDFISLYRAAVLYVEMAYYRKAEADLRAILTFSDNEELRIKAYILTARIKSLQDSIDEAYAIILNIFQSSDYIPDEAYVWGLEFYSHNNTVIDMTELKTFLDNANNVYGYKDIPGIPTPELVFGVGSSDIYFTGTALSNTPPVMLTEKPEHEVSAAIQLGSFSMKENAEDLVRSVGIHGYKAFIKSKIVNEKEYFAVTVPIDESKNVQNLIIELKEKGFEGYPVY